MKMKQKRSLSFNILIAIILIAGTYFLTANFFVSTDDSFTKDYAIFLNDLNNANAILFTAQKNLNLCNEYTQSEGGYYYDYAIEYLDYAKQQSAEARETFLAYQTKLPLMKENAPSQFFQEEIDNRIIQVDGLVAYADGVYTLSDYLEKQLYEVNYGSQDKAEELYEKYEAKRLVFNEELVALNEVERTIDANWGKDWYPEILFDAE